MTVDQVLSMGVLAGTLVLFVWNRLRYDLVAMLSLAAGLATGIVPLDAAFSGFSDQVVVVVAGALVVSAALSRSGIVERVIRPLAPYLSKPDAQVGTLVAMVTVLSAFMKNIGALAMFIPVALTLARRAQTPPSLVLMPLAFASLTGGLITLIGTSPNIIVARIRGEITGTPFAMFDFAPVGAGIALAGAAFLTFGWRLLPKDRQAGARPEDRFRIADYLTEVRVMPGSPLIGSTVADFELYSEGAVAVAAIIRGQGHRYIPGESWNFDEGDILVVEGAPDDLKPLLSSARLQLVGRSAAVAGMEELEIAEMVVGPQSPLLGQALERSDVRTRFGVSVLAISRGGRHFVSRIRTIAPQVGDVLVVEGESQALPRIIAELGCLPLAHRNLQLGAQRVAVPVVVLAVAMVAIATGLVPVSIGFFAAALAMVLFGALSPRDAYRAIDWPIIVMLGALIPVSDAIQRTGASGLIAGWLREVAVLLPPSGAVALTMLAAMMLTPFLNNAATVLVMAPIGASLAKQLGLGVDAFLMAVAVGAACDFLTPIGHQCNTLVMGPGGYRFGDYWRLGLPLSAIVLAVGVPLILLVWPV